MLNDKKLISANAIARELGCCPRTALSLLKRGVFGSVIQLSEGRSRTHYRVRRSDFLSYLTRNGLAVSLFDNSA